MKKNVLPVRQNRRDDYRGQWWQYARPLPEMRTALVGQHRYIVTPRVAKHRIFVWLDNAHQKLDVAVFAAYGWPDNLSDDEILARLLELNLQRAGASVRLEGD